MSSDTLLKTAVAFLLMVAVSVAVGGGFYSRYVALDGVSLYAFLFGGKGLVELIISGSTLFAATVTVILLFRRADFDRKQIALSEEAARLNQFKEGAALLANDKHSANVNGMILLGALAAQVPGRFRVPAALALSAFLHDATDPTWKEFADAIQDHAPIPAHQPSGKAVVMAMSVLGSLRASDGLGVNWPPQLGRRAGMLRLEALYLCDITFAKADFSNFEIIDFIVRRLAFEEVNLRNSEVDVISDDGIRFEDCDLTNLRLTLRNTQRQDVANVVARRCTLDGATINGQPIIATQ